MHQKSISHSEALGFGYKRLHDCRLVKLACWQKFANNFSLYWGQYFCAKRWMFLISNEQDDVQAAAAQGEEVHFASVDSVSWVSACDNDYRAQWHSLVTEIKTFIPNSASYYFASVCIILHTWFVKMYSFFLIFILNTSFALIYSQLISLAVTLITLLFINTISLKFHLLLFFLFNTICSHSCIAKIEATW